LTTWGGKVYGWTMAHFALVHLLTTISMAFDKLRVSLKKQHKSEAGGLTEKGRDYYNSKTGANLQAPVTEDKPTGKRKKRQKSFCSRMGGMKEDNNIDCRENPDKRICKALKRWSCD